VYIVDKLLEEESIAHTIPWAYITLLTVMQTVEGRELNDLLDNTAHCYIDYWRKGVVMRAPKGK